MIVIIGIYWPIAVFPIMFWLGYIPDVFTTFNAHVNRVKWVQMQMHQSNRRYSGPRQWV